MMFKPRCPSAGPIGGLGLALPAGTCSLMKPTIFFAITVSCYGCKRTLRVLPGFTFQAPPCRRPKGAGTSSFLDLRKIQLHRGRPPENGHRNPQLALLVVHVLHVAVKVGE